MGYIITFFNDVEALTNTYASYQTIMLSTIEKYPELKTGVPSYFKIDDQSRLALLGILNDLRFYLIRVHTKAMALKHKIKELNEPDLENIYQTIKIQTVLNVEEIEKYVFKIHECFVKGALEDLLVKISNLYPKLVNNE